VQRPSPRDGYELLMHIDTISRMRSPHLDERWDAFVCHASEDKQRYVLPLALGLRERGFRIWLDDWCLDLGSRLTQSIENGLSQSRFGVVMLSQAFFKKKWPRQELSTLMDKESADARVILPVWCDVSLQEIRANAPLLADRVAAKYEEGLATIIDRIVRVLMINTGGTAARPGEDPVPISWESLAALTKRLYPDLSVDEFWQTQLLADLDNASFRSISDIERAVDRARVAVLAYAQDVPAFFESGTDYLTKSLGFVDLCFRARHNWNPVTRAAFLKYEHLVDWRDLGNHPS
jgi:hypothetical protein